MLPSGIGAPGAPGAWDGSKASPRLPGRPDPGLPPLTVPAGADPDDGEEGAALPPLPSFRRNSTSSWNLRSCSFSCRFSYWRVSICPDMIRDWFSMRPRRTTSSEASCAAAGGPRSRPPRIVVSARRVRRRAGMMGCGPMEARGPIRCAVPRQNCGAANSSRDRLPVLRRNRQADVDRVSDPRRITPRRRGPARSPRGGSATSTRCRCTPPPAAPCRRRPCASGSRRCPGWPCSR
ncbi:hypothetical protein MEME101129_13765 [Methylobacterium mesophilicum]